MRINSERQLSSLAALHVAEETIKAYQLLVDNKYYGDKFKTHHCQLIDTKSKSIYFGCGKGIGLQSKVSAHYEALEHYATHQFSKNIKDLHFLPFQKNNSALIPHVFLQTTENNKPLPYPLFQIDPRYAKSPLKNDHFNYASYTFNTSDSGIASGSHFLEASIHALNELIERDAYSLFLIDAFIKPNSTLREINKKSLPKKLGKMVNYIEKKYGDELALFDITSLIGVPTIFVSMTRQPHLIQPKGVGTSLFREYAMERALLECLQPLHIYNEKSASNQKQIISNLANAPLLQKCAMADITPLSHKKRMIDFSLLASYNPPMPLDEQFQLLKNKITSQGFSIYYKVLTELSTGFTCVKYHVPAFEQFYLVQTGKFVLPQQWARIQQSA